VPGLGEQLEQEADAAAEVKHPSVVFDPVPRTIS
jgi:hypothetical protein